MFIDEVLDKFRLEDAFAPYTVTLLGGGHVVVSGVRSVVFSSDTEVRVRCAKNTLTVRGENLAIAEIGGGDAYIKGGVKGVDID